MADQPKYTRVGPRLRELRAARRVSGKVLAGKMGCSDSALYQVERGQALPTISGLGEWADALGALRELPVLMQLMREDAEAARQEGTRQHQTIAYRAPAQAVR